MGRVCLFLKCAHRGPLPTCNYCRNIRPRKCLQPASLEIDLLVVVVASPTHGTHGYPRLSTYWAYREVPVTQPTPTEILVADMHVHFHKTRSRCREEFWCFITCTTLTYAIYRDGRTKGYIYSLISCFALWVSPLVFELNIVAAIILGNGCQLLRNGGCLAPSFNSPCKIRER